MDVVAAQKEVGIPLILQPSEFKCLAYYVSGIELIYDCYARI